MGGNARASDAFPPISGSSPFFARGSRRVLGDSLPPYPLPSSLRSRDRAVRVVGSLSRGEQRVPRYSPAGFPARERGLFFSLARVARARRPREAGPRGRLTSARCYTCCLVAATCLPAERQPRLNAIVLVGSTFRSLGRDYLECTVVVRDTKRRPRPSQHHHHRPRRRRRRRASKRDSKSERGREGDHPLV